MWVYPPMRSLSKQLKEHLPPCIGVAPSQHGATPSLEGTSSSSSQYEESEEEESESEDMEDDTQTQPPQPEAMPAQRSGTEQFSKAGMPSRHQPPLAPDTAMVRSAFSKAAMPQMIHPPAQAHVPFPAQAHMPPPAQMQMMPFNGQQFQMMAAMHVRPAPNGFYMGNQFVNQQGQLMPWESKISTDTVSFSPHFPWLPRNWHSEQSLLMLEAISSASAPHLLVETDWDHLCANLRQTVQNLGDVRLLHLCHISQRTHELSLGHDLLTLHGFHRGVGLGRLHCLHWGHDVGTVWENYCRSLSLDQLQQNGDCSCSIVFSMFDDPMQVFHPTVFTRFLLFVKHHCWDFASARKNWCHRHHLFGPWLDEALPGLASRAASPTKMKQIHPPKKAKTPNHKKTRQE